MSLHELTVTGLIELDATTFRDVQIHERYDLQRVLRDHVGVIAEGALVIAEEFCEWEDSSRRIDLLAVEPDGALVVIELKRTRDGGFMDLQAVRYAAMVSAMTFDRAVDVLRRFLLRDGREGDARTMLREHLEDADESRFGNRVRIVLASMDFGKELTTAVMWLNEQGLDIRCVRLTPYSIDDRLLLDVLQVIPLPEAADYIVKLKEKAREERQAKERDEWTGVWFVNVGMDSPDVPESNGRHWNNCRRHGYIAAGGAPKYSGPLRKLRPGEPIMAYVKQGVGYVGFGVVTREAVPAHEFKCTDGRKLDDHLDGLFSRGNSVGNEPNWEWALQVDWKATVSLNDGKKFEGIFANQNIVCRLRDAETLKFLADEFQLDLGKFRRIDQHGNI